MYTVKVSGVEGVLSAQVFVNGTEPITEVFPVADVRDANKAARAAALRHKNDTRAHRVENYEHSFEL